MLGIRILLLSSLQLRRVTPSCGFPGSRPTATSNSIRCGTRCVATRALRRLLPRLRQRRSSQEWTLINANCVRLASGRASITEYASGIFVFFLTLEFAALHFDHGDVWLHC